MFEKIIPFITLKEITPVASLNSDSPSIIRFSLLGIGNLLKIAATAAASVAASIEPKRIPWIIGTLKIILTPTPIRKMVRISPIIAKNPIGIIYLLISFSLNFRADSNIRSGIKTNNIKSGTLFTIES